MTKKMILAGGTGFLGRTLAKWFKERGYDVVVFSRKNISVECARVVYWDGKNLGAWAQELEGAKAVINLAGRSVNCRYTAKNRKDILESRMFSTQILGEAITKCSIPPKVWLNSSTATIYKHTYASPHTEAHGEIQGTLEAKDNFSVQVAQAWEQAFNNAHTPATRKVTLRMAMVMGNEPGGVHDALSGLTRIGLGGRMGNGRQFVSWIHSVDLCRSLEWLIDNGDAKGVYNICSPNPMPNGEMMKSFRKVLGVPLGLPATLWMLEIGTWIMRTESELVIKSRNVIPQRLLDQGFNFNFPHFEDAIKDIRIVDENN